MKSYNSGKSNPAFYHGMYKTHLYYVWHGIKSRCYTPTTSGYKYYGGRGIVVCEEWKKQFCCI